MEGLAAHLAEVAGTVAERTCPRLTMANNERKLMKDGANIAYAALMHPPGL